MRAPRSCCARIRFHRWTRRSLSRKKNWLAVIITQKPTPPPLRRLLSEQLALPERLIHINAGSELILRQRKTLIKPLNNPQLGPGYMRVTTALPEDNKHFLDVMGAVLAES